jgi:hypothetical protein
MGVGLGAQLAAVAMQTTSEVNFSPLRMVILAE